MYFDCIFINIKLFKEAYKREDAVNGDHEIGSKLQPTRLHWVNDLREKVFIQERIFIISFRHWKLCDSIVLKENLVEECLY